MSGHAVAATLVVPAQVRLPAVSGAVSLYAVDVHGDEGVKRNSRTTITLTQDGPGPKAHLRYYPSLTGADADVDVDAAVESRLRANWGTGPGAWFQKACDPEDGTAASGGSAAAGSGTAGPPVPRVEYGPEVEKTDLGFEIDYRKDCPNGEEHDRYGRLLMMPAPESENGASIMVDVDLQGLGTGPSPESVRTYLRDVAERVRKLDSR